MESIVSTCNPIFLLHKSPINAVTASSNKSFVLSKSRIQGKQLMRCNYGSIRHSNNVPRGKKSTIRCGAITEINESQFGDLVLKSECPVLVEFVATWCGPCRLIAPAMESLAQEYGDKLTIVKIDHDANPKLIEEYKVYGLPTLILFNNGQEVPESRREGAITKVKLKEYIDSLLKSTSVA